MYIAMNRFKVAKTETAAFEAIWTTRRSYLGELAGFVEFALLRGPERDDHILYSSHTVWDNEENFKAWTRSEQFRKAHAGAGAGQTRQVMLGHPEFEGFTAVLVQRNAAAPAAA